MYIAEFGGIKTFHINEGCWLTARACSGVGSTDKAPVMAPRRDDVSHIVSRLKSRWQAVQGWTAEGSSNCWCSGGVTGDFVNPLTQMGPNLVLSLFPSGTNVYMCEAGTDMKGSRHRQL